MKILTGIDLPFKPNCGSMILVNDLYSDLPKDVSVRFLALSPSTPKNWSSIKDVHLLKIDKVTDPKEYKPYLKLLSDEIKKQVADFKPDLIHIQHLSFGMALEFAKLSLPKVAICHGTDIQYSLLSDFHKQNMFNIYNKSDEVVFPTKRIFDEFVKLTHLTEKSVIIPWGLPDKAFSGGLKKILKKGNSILYAGRLDSNKNVDMIIDSLKHVDPKIHLTIIGEGDQKDLLIKKVSKLGFQNRVKFEDFKPRQELWKEFSKFDAIVVSTKTIEAFCLMAIEAQAHGLPLIYARTNGLMDVIGSSGIGFNPNSTVDLTNAINKITQSYDLRKEYSRKGLKNSEKYKIAETRKRFLEVSQQVLNNHE